MKQYIAVIDLKSFYASMECILRGLDPLKALLVVCDESRGDSTIVLSASHALKKQYGVKNVSRKRDLPKVEGLIFATPRMQTYVEASAAVMSIFLEFVGEDDLHVYSIDEAFLNLTPYLKLYKCDAITLVKRILRRVKEKLGLVATAGIGDNFILAKLALDNEAKYNKDFIAYWSKDDVKTKLWGMKNLDKMWGINRNTERHLNKIGIYDIETLANFPDDILQKEFGIIGLQLKEHANGIDDTNIREKYHSKDTSLSLGQVLMRDYDKKEAKLIIREMCDDLSRRMRLNELMCKKVGLYVMYSMEQFGGFAHQLTIREYTDNEDVLYENLIKIYDQYVENNPIRRINITFSNFKHADSMQLDIFSDQEAQVKNRSLSKALDEIKDLYGPNSVLRLSALTKESTIKERHNQIGGHKK